jgi:hypothetical protein
MKTEGQNEIAPYVPDRTCHCDGTGYLIEDHDQMSIKRPCLACDVYTDSVPKQSRDSCTVCNGTGKITQETAYATITKKCICINQNQTIK